MTDEELLDSHRCLIGGVKGINYIFSITPQADHAIDIDVVTRCEAAAQIVSAGRRLGMFRFHPILIIGGGAAGITAALVALSLQIDGITVSNGTDFFQSQRDCRHRYLHPRIYRWPETGCESPEYVPKLAGLRWIAGYAADVAQQWSGQTEELVADERFKQIPPIPNQFTVNSTSDITSLIRTAEGEQEWGMVLFCIAPRENITVGSFSGIPFWEPDKLDLRQCGCSHEQPRILICGSGDGALQDFLRTSCPNKTIVELHRQLEQMFDVLAATKSYDIKTETQELANLPRESFEILHARTRGIVDKVFSSPEGMAAVKGFVEGTDASLANGRSVTLVWTRDYFRKCYFLNRFLALLVGKWREVSLGQIPFLSGARLEHVQESHDGYIVQFDPHSFALNGQSFHRVIPRLGVEDISVSTVENRLVIQRNPSEESA